MNKTKTKRGFTLIEVLIAMAVLTVVVLAATNLLVSVIRVNANNMNTIIAYGLAQEGIEGVRNIRDSNWLLGMNYKKNGVLKIKGTQIQLWGAALPGVTAPHTQNSGETKYYLLDYGKLEAGNMGDGNNTSVSLSSFDAPWVLIEVPPLTGESEDDLIFSNKTLLNKVQDNFGTPDYIYKTVENGSNANTPFHRLIKIEMLDHPVGDHALYGQEYRVTSTVAWNDGQINRKEVLTTDLTDWKAGAL